MNSEKYIGLDVHQATISVAVMDSRGKVVMESILETKAATILEFLNHRKIKISHRFCLGKRLRSAGSHGERTWANFRTRSTADIGG